MLKKEFYFSFFNLSFFSFNINFKMTECALSQLELFRGANYQTSVEGSYYTLVTPSTEISSSTLTFDIKSNKDYTDPSNIFVLVDVGIKKRSGDKYVQLKDEDAMGPSNNFLSSLFSQGLIYLNNKQIENSNKKYGYKAYIQNTVNYNSEAKSCFLSSSLYVPDKPGTNEKFTVYSIDHSTDAVIEELASTTTAVTVDKMNEVIKRINTLLATDNKIVRKLQSPINGYYERKKKFVENEFVQLMGPLHIDLTRTNLFIPPSVNIKISLDKADPKFCLMGADKTSEYIVEISKNNLMVK